MTVGWSLFRAVRGVSRVETLRLTECYVPRLLVRRIGTFRDDAPFDHTDSRIDRVNGTLCATANALAWLEHIVKECKFG